MRTPTIINRIRDIRNQSGVSLIELTITTGLLLFVIAGIYNFDFLATQQNNRASSLINSRRAAAQTIDKLTVDIRETQDLSKIKSAITLADRNELTIYVNVDDDDNLERVHYQLNGTDLERSVSQSATGTPEIFGPEETKVTAEGLVNDNSSPLFRYYQDSDTEMSGLPLSSANRAKVRLIRVNPVVRDDYRDVTLQTDVFLRNTKPL